MNPVETDRRRRVLVGVAAACILTAALMWQWIGGDDTMRCDNRALQQAMLLDGPTFAPDSYVRSARCDGDWARVGLGWNNPESFQVGYSTGMERGIC